MKNWQKASVITSLVLTVVLIVNTSLMAYMNYQTTFTASMAPTGSQEALDIHLKAAAGRPSPLMYYLRQARGWISAYYVGGVEKTNAETGIIVTIDGANIAATASVDYYIEAKESTGQGQAYRFLEGNGTSVTVNGADLDLSNQTSIENHLTAMGLSTTADHTIDYYVYVKASATGAVSGETLTSEITYQKFDSVTYEYGEIITETPELTADYYIDTVDKQDENWLLIRSANRHPSEDDWCGIGMRFDFRNDAQTAMLIPEDAVIDEATIRLFWKQDHDTAMAAQWLSENDEDIISHDTEWRNSAVWSNTRINVTLPVADAFDTLNQDITDIVQELVDAPNYNLTNLKDLELVCRDQDMADTDTSRDAWFYDEGDPYTPLLTVKYQGYDASWYPIGPVSVLSMPLGQTLGAITVIAVSCYAVYTAIIRGEKKK